jgi:hypothetical protein
LQRVALLLEQPSDAVVADRMPLGGQRTSQLRGRLARPPQRRLGIPTSVGIDQGVQRPKQVWVTLGQPLAPTARAPNAPGRQPTAGSWVVQLGQASVHGLPRGPGRPCDRGDPPAAKPPRPGGASSSRRCRSSRYGQTSEYAAAKATSGRVSMP